MIIRVGIKDKQFSISVGSGVQKIIWLANVAISRYDKNYGLELGKPAAVKTEEGEIIDMNSIINEKLKDGQQVYVVLIPIGENSSASTNK